MRVVRYVINSSIFCVKTLQLSDDFSLVFLIEAVLKGWVCHNHLGHLKICADQWDNHMRTKLKGDTLFRFRLIGRPPDVQFRLNELAQNIDEFAQRDKIEEQYMPEVCPVKTPF